MFGLGPIRGKATPRFIWRRIGGVTKMCLGIYGRVVSVKGDVASVDFGGITKDALVATDDVDIGSYVVVHAGVIISTVDEETFEESMRAIMQIVEGLERDADTTTGLKDSLSGERG